MKKILILLCLIFCTAVLFAEPKLQLYKDMIVTENLRLRADKGREVVMVLKAGSKVKITYIDKKVETVDGITNNWVKVEVQENAFDKNGNRIKYGVVGWCFGGYLKETGQIAHKPDYANGNGTILSESENDGQKLQIRKHQQKIKIGNCAMDSQRIIYSDIKQSETLCTVQDNDVIEISEIWTLTGEDCPRQIWLKVQVNGYSGFLHYSPYRRFSWKETMDAHDPYKNNSWEIIETVNSSNKKWTVRKLSQGLAVSSYEDTELRDMPGENGTKVIAYLPGYKKEQQLFFCTTEAITEEVDSEKGGEPWVRCSYEGKTGWIYGGYLSAERGGPKYYIPDESISLYWF